MGNLHAGESEYSIERPKASHHCRLIVVCAKADGERLRVALKGRAVIKRDGQIVVELPLSPETLKECPWFEDKDKGVFAAFFLHDPITLDRSFKAHGKYAVEIVLSGQPPSSSTVWFFYLPWHFGYL